MKNAIRHAAAGALAALAIGATAPAATSMAMVVSAPATATRTQTATPAHALAVRHWTLVESTSGSKQQACKVSANGGTIWVIHNRVDARNAAARSRATTTVTHNGAATSRRWASGWVTRGHISAVGSVNYPRQPGYALEVSLGGDNSGTGKIMSPAAIGHC